MHRFSNKNLLTALILALVALGQFAIDIYLPSFSSMVEQLKTNKSLVQLSLSFFLISYGLSQLIYGPLSDAFGRRKVLFCGMAIFIVGSLGTTFSASIFWVLVTRFIQGAGIGAANVLCRAILRDLYHGLELRRKTPFLGMVWVISPILAPVIGAYLEEYFGWRANFVFLTLLVALVSVLIFFIVPETKDPAQRHAFHPKVIFKNYYDLIAHRSFMGYILTAMIVFGMFSCFYAVGPFLLQVTIGLSVIHLGWTLLLISFGYMLGSFLNMHFTHRFSLKHLMQGGLWILFFTSLAMILFGLFGKIDYFVFVIPQFILFFGIGFIFTNSIAGSLSLFPHLAGSTSSLWGFFAYLGGTISSSVISLFPENNQLPLALAFFIQTVLTALVLWIFTLREGTEPQ